MGSGSKRMIINTRERAVSNDFNRLQSFKDAAVVDALAYLLDSQGVDSFGVSQGTSGGVTSVGSTTGTPLRGVILGGLLVKPQIGSTGTLVDPGILLACNPDVSPSPDDSNYRLVSSSGITDTAALPMPANSSGGAQIYIVECQQTDTVLETSSRDIYDPLTGLFTPAVVDKVRRSTLGFRIRTVAIASGVTAAAGWLPLMIAVVPDGSTTWNDAVHIWDVRPLTADRYASLRPLSTKYADIIESNWRLDFGTPNLRGRVVAQSPGGRILGGEVTLDALGTGIDTTSTSIQAAGFAFTTNTPYYLYLCEPYNLPRWCRYTSVASGSRVPGPLRGMPVLVDAATAPPFAGINSNSTAFNMPSAFGFSQQVAQGTAVCVWAGMVTAANAQVQDGVGDGVVFTQSSAQTINSGASTTSTATFTLSSNAHFPRNARAIWVQVSILYAGNVAAANQLDQSIQFSDNAGNLLTLVLWEDRKYFNTGTPYRLLTRVRVPIANSLPSNSVPVITLLVNHNALQLGYAVAPDTAAVFVTGWELR